MVDRKNPEVKIKCACCKKKWAFNESFFRSQSWHELFSKTAEYSLEKGWTMICTECQHKHNKYYEPHFK